MNFNEALEILDEGIRILPVTKKFVRLAKPGLAPKGDMQKTLHGLQYKKYGDYKLVKHPTKAGKFLYIKKREGATLDQQVGGAGFMGFVYVIDKAAARKRSKRMKKIPKSVRKKAARKAARTRKLNKR